MADPTIMCYQSVQEEFIKAWCEEEHTEADLLPPLLCSLKFQLIILLGVSLHK